MHDDSYDSYEVDADVSDTDSSELNERGAEGGNPIHHPEYDTEEARRRSFQNVEQNIRNHTPEDMAAAGFFYSHRKHDEVCCFHCGVRVWHWKHDELPLEKHVKKNKSCPFVRQILGEEKIDGIFKSMTDVGALEAKSELNEIGYEPDAIREAVSNVTNKVSDTINHKDYTKAADNLRKSKIGESGSSSDLLICIACRTKERTIMFLPCSCTVSCSSCAENVKTCFNCSREVKEAMRVYFA